MAQPLRILVAGAGIGGLATALACSRAGHEVKVFEQVAALEPLGAGIQLGPNVTRVLHQWGLASRLNQVAASPARLRVRDAHTGAELGQLRLGDEMLKRYGAPYVTLRRADLQGLLAQALAHALAYERGNFQGGAQSNAGGPPVEFGHTVSGFTQDAAAVQLHLNTADGQALVQRADLLAGADGLWSRIRESLLGDGQPNPTGHKALRCLIRQSDLPAPLRRSLNADDIGVWLGPHLHVVHYPVQGGEWLNLVVIIENRHPARTGEWSQRVDSAVLAPVLAGIHSALRELLSVPGQQGGQSPEWRQWDLFSRPPMHNGRGHGVGRVALLGDAAHPMLPFLAQGAGMAIEDAQALAAALAEEADVATQLEAFRQARWQRNAKVQARAQRNGKIFHARGVVRWGRDVAMKRLGERILDVPWLYRGA